LRVVELLENAYPDFPGLNLTFEVREGLQKHERSSGFPTLEAQIADLADEITYYSHDLDDAVDFEILNAAQLQEDGIWRKSQRAVLARYAGVREPELHKLIIRDIIDHEVRDLVVTSAKSIAQSDAQSADDVRQQPSSLIRYSDELADANRALRKFLYQNVYYHPRVSEVNRRACEMLREVFGAYLADPERLGEAAAKRIEAEGLHRTGCDYIAGMTDRYLMEEYTRIVAL
jgi:dGTPase